MTVLIATGDIPAKSTGALGSIDLGILAVYLIATVAWGAWPRKGGDSPEAFLLGGRSVAWPLLMMSIVATETSTVTFLSLPGKSFVEGGNFGLMQLTIGYIIGRLLVLAFMLPEYFRGQLFTAYEMLQERFGANVRGVASLMFLVCRTLADGLRLFLTALALQQALGWDFTGCVMVITVATAVYATLGGVSSVVKNDCLQLVIYTGGAVLAACLLVRGVPGGVDRILEFGDETGRLRVLDFGLGLTGGVTFWSGLIGGLFLTLATHGVDHLTVQRYLCAGSQRKAAVALGLSGPIVALQFALFLFIGLGMAAYYHHNSPGYEIARGDAAFAAFLANETPVGLCGLLFASVLAAAMSTLSSSVNASAGVLVKDLIEPALGAGNATTGVRRARVATILFAVLQAGVAIGAGTFLDRDSAVINNVLAIAGLATGMLVGLFALSVLVRNASQNAAFAALGAGVAVCVLLLGWNAAAGTVIEDAFPVSGWWNALIASTTTLAGGLLAHALGADRTTTQKEPLA